VLASDAGKTVDRMISTLEDGFYRTGCQIDSGRYVVVVSKFLQRFESKRALVESTDSVLIPSAQCMSLAIAIREVLDA
jgi:hypothetical protein